MRTFEEMAEMIATRTGHTPERVLEALTPNGEVWPLCFKFIEMFPEELPSDVPNPQRGDVRHQDGRTTVWTGSAWE